MTKATMFFEKFGSCKRVSYFIVYSLRFDAVEIYLRAACHAFSLQHLSGKYCSKERGKLMQF